MSKEREVAIDVADGLLAGTLELPDHPRGVVVLAQETGSERLSQRHRDIAHRLREHGLGALRIELLTDEEEQTERWTRHLRSEEDETEAQARYLRLEVSVFTDRLLAVSQWVKRTLALDMAYFGASTAAAAALSAAARGADVAAVVSREGCPDLAAEALTSVRAPTLLLVDAEDGPTLERNRSALGALRGPADLTVVPGGMQFCEEPSILDAVAELATRWYDRFIPGPLH